MDARNVRVQGIIVDEQEYRRMEQIVDNYDDLVDGTPRAMLTIYHKPIHSYRHHIIINEFDIRFYSFLKEGGLAELDVCNRIRAEIEIHNKEAESLAREVVKLRGSIDTIKDEFKNSEEKLSRIPLWIRKFFKAI